MTRCKQCLTKAETRDGLCPVCGIDPLKSRADLTAAEKRIKLHARAIRLLAMFHLVLAGYALIMLPYFPAPFPIVMMALINLLIGVGLARFGLGAKKGATVYYFLIGMVSVISIQQGSVYLGGIILCLIGIYIVGNPTARALFERQPID